MDELTAGAVIAAAVTIGVALAGAIKAMAQALKQAVVSRRSDSRGDSESEAPCVRQIETLSRLMHEHGATIVKQQSEIAMQLLESAKLHELQRVDEVRSRALDRDERKAIVIALRKLAEVVESLDRKVYDLTAEQNRLGVAINEVRAAVAK